jgi:murein DD-endopeptidase MepM/ murein hydrolase activator NlpD
MSGDGDKRHSLYPPRPAYAATVPLALRSSVLWASCLFLCLLVAGCQSVPNGAFLPDPNVDYSRGMLHRVVEGDCLSMICQYYRRDASLLVYLNRLRSPYLLHEGEFLYIPPENDDGVIRSGTLTLADIQATRDARSRRALTESKPPEYLKSRRTSLEPKLRAVSSSDLGDESPVDSSSELGEGGPNEEHGLLHVKSVLNLKSKIPFLGGKRESSREVADAPPRQTRLGFLWPAQGRFARGFSLARLRPHKGVDVSAPRGTPIYAAESGKVLFSGPMRGSGYGNVVVIDHGAGFSSLYAHASKILVSGGQVVERGDPIALVGRTGRSTGNHVHFEIRYNGIAINPEKYLPEREGRAIAFRRGR